MFNKKTDGVNDGIVPEAKEAPKAKEKKEPTRAMILAKEEIEKAKLVVEKWKKELADLEEEANKE